MGYSQRYVSIHTLHELEARQDRRSRICRRRPVRFHSYASRIGSKIFTLKVRQNTRGKQQGFHSYASRIGSKVHITTMKIPYVSDEGVSIHTLHELEASPTKNNLNEVVCEKCFHSYASRIGSKEPFSYCLRRALPASFHSYASRIGSKRLFPISFHRPLEGRFHSYASRIGSKQPARWLVGCTLDSIRFHSYASRIGSKTSFAKLGCTRIVQRFFVGY